MSDDVKEPEGKETPAPPKTYSEEELKKVIAERDKAKAKLREREEEDKKALEAKAIEEGKLKEVLAAREAELQEAKKKLEAVEAAQREQRDKALEEVPEEFRKFIGHATDASMIHEFMKTLESKKIPTHTDNKPKDNPQPKKEVLRDYVQGDRNALIPKL